MKAWIIENVLYFDKEGGALILKHARKSHKTLKQTAIAALKRGFRHAKKESSMDTPPLPRRRRS